MLEKRAEQAQKQTQAVPGLGDGRGARKGRPVLALDSGLHGSCNLCHVGFEVQQSAHVRELKELTLWKHLSGSSKSPLASWKATQCCTPSEAQLVLKSSRCFYDPLEDPVVSYSYGHGCPLWVRKTKSERQLDGPRFGRAR